MRHINSTTNNMRQRHGLVTQNHVLNYFNYKPAKYGEIWDGYTNDQNQTPVTIKTTCENNSICLSDFRRQVNIDRDFIFVHVRMNKERNRIIEMNSVYVHIENWKKAFGNLEVMNFMYKRLKNVKNDHSDDAKWGRLVNRIHRVYGENSPIRIAPKRDCGKMKQKRFQGAITLNNFRNLMNENTIIFSKVY